MVADPPSVRQRGCTRLAPSPTGALHLGNARTFLVTWALARQQGLRVVLRIEDLDTPRVKPGVIDQTIDTLRWLGLDWDQGPIIQSEEGSPHHRAAMEALAAKRMVYPCVRTRREIAEQTNARTDEGGASPQSAPNEGSHELVYPASLRPPTMPDRFADDQPAWRFATPEGEVTFTDLFAGPQRRSPERSIGDFVVWTRRPTSAPPAQSADQATRQAAGQAAYQLAVVVDDARQGVTLVVRGDDLLDSAARQLLLMRALALAPEPAYCHLPLVRGSDGRRLAKRHGDTRIDHYRAAGVHADRVRGLLGWWCGISTTGGGPHAALSPQEFLQAFDLSTMPRHDITFRPEDDAWLLQR